jgi:hypothetical protein
MHERGYETCICMAGGLNPVTRQRDELPAADCHPGDGRYGKAAA